MCGQAGAEEVWWKTAGKSDSEDDPSEYMDGEEDEGDSEYLPPPHVAVTPAIMRSVWQQRAEKYQQSKPKKGAKTSDQHYNEKAYSMLPELPLLPPDAAPRQ